MKLKTSELIGFSVVEKVSADAHARIGEVPPPDEAIAGAFTRNGEVPGNSAPLLSSMFARDGETPTNT